MALISRTRAVACLAGAGLALAALTVPASSTTTASTAQAPATAPGTASKAAARRASMRFSPRSFVGGQRLTFVGNIGRNGRRPLRLQVHMGRPGDSWNTIDGVRGRTKRDGSFRFTYQAPSMRDKRMRVRSGRLTTPARVFNARSQDLVLSAPDDVRAGVPFDIRVDTTPEDLRRRPDLPGPVFAGRTLTLQKRVTPAGPVGYSSQWQQVGSRVQTDARGNGLFEDVTEESPGDAVYRVRQENWTRGGDRIGWFASFPTTLQEAASGPRPTRAGSAAAPDARTQPLARGGGSTTAGVKYGWAPALWDFGWAYGESLTTRPHRGSDPQGWWLDAATGTGRAVQHNGQLMLDSQRESHDDYDRSVGDTMATLRGNPMRLGRWEVRIRMKSTDTAHQDFRSKIELVPDDPADYADGARTITIADMAAHSNTVRIGASAPNGRSWSRNVGNVKVRDVNHAFAVEVGKKHISWFREGRVIGTLKSRAAIPDVPMTLRLRLEGQGDQAMNRTQTYYDWMRAYSLKRGRTVTNGPAVR